VLRMDIYIVNFTYGSAHIMVYIWVRISDGVFVHIFRIECTKTNTIYIYIYNVHI
jgi:hypothetical protein